MKTKYENGWKITECDSVSQMVCNLLDKADATIWRYSEEFELKINSKIAQCLIKGMSEEKTYNETKKYVKKSLGEYFDLTKFYEYYTRYGRPTCDIIIKNIK